MPKYMPVTMLVPMFMLADLAHMHPAYACLCFCFCFCSCLCLCVLYLCSCLCSYASAFTYACPYACLCANAYAVINDYAFDLLFVFILCYVVLSLSIRPCLLSVHMAEPSVRLVLRLISCLHLFVSCRIQISRLHFIPKRRFRLGEQRTSSIPRRRKSHKVLHSLQRLPTRDAFHGQHGGERLQ